MATTPETRALIREAYQTGERLKDIAERHGLSLSYTSVIAREGVGIRKSGKTFKLSREEKDEVHRAVEQGEKFEAIALRFKITRQAVRDIARARGCPARPRGGPT